MAVFRASEFPRRALSRKAVAAGGVLPALGASHPRGAAERSGAGGVIAVAIPKRQPPRHIAGKVAKSTGFGGRIAVQFARESGTRMRVRLPAGAQGA